MLEPKLELSHDLNKLSYDVIGAAIEVHRHLGPGYLESVYEDALAIELELRGIPFLRQLPLSIDYKGARIGNHQLDFLIDERLIVELKTVEAIAEIHRAQLLSYLKSTRLQLGLILNFKVPTMRDGVHRIILTRM